MRRGGAPVGGSPHPILPGSATMNFPERRRLLPWIVGFAISAALLWLGAEVFAAARARTQRSSRRRLAAALVIVGSGLWWPGHFLEPAEAAGGLAGGISPVAALLALALAGLAGATAVAGTCKTLPAFAGLALLTLTVAYAHTVFATPGLFRKSTAIGPWGPCVAILILATALVVIGLEFKPSRKVCAARATCAALGALLLTLAAASPGEPVVALMPAWTEANWARIFRSTTLAPATRASAICASSPPRS